VGEFTDPKPMACQDVDGEPVPVEAAFERVEGHHEFGFRVGEYDPSRTLILDPAILVYCGYCGGANSDFCKGIAVDAAGNAYLGGTTYSDEQTFPVKTGPDLTYNGGRPDAFVAKVDATGSTLVYCGYIGGSSSTSVSGIAVDAAGNAYVTGTTRSSNLPVKVGPDLTYNGGSYGDAYVAKVNTAGTTLVYCGYIGGKDSDIGSRIDVDASGNAFVAGRTRSTETSFPVRAGPDLTHNGYYDVFVAKVNGSGSTLVYCQCR